MNVHDFATSTLHERLLSKISTTPTSSGCLHWLGAFNTDGRPRGRRYRTRRPVIQLGRVGSPVVYVAPLLLALAGDGNIRPTARDGVRLFALHRCAPPGDGIYRCVALEHLRWGTQMENEAEKALWAAARMHADPRTIAEQLAALQVCEAYLL